MNRFVIVALLVAVAALVVGWNVVRPWWTAASTSVVTGDVTYICTETRDVISGPPQPTPALNPKTGRRTLVVAVRSPQGQWVPAPPEELQRGQPERRH